jgi:large subunit ribosomal protein L9
MNVLLIRDVPGFGQAGEIKNARPGYVRNYLFPNKLAVEATAERLELAKKNAASLEKQKARAEQSLNEVIDRLQTLELRFKSPANAEGKLYGSVTSSQILDTVRKQFQVDVPASVAITPASYKALGQHESTWTFPNHRTVRLTIHIETTT